MCLADLTGTREVITAAATAEVPGDKPAICGAVTLHLLDEEDPLHLSMPMLDALLLLNSLRAIEQEFGLQQWAEHLDSGEATMEEMAAEVRHYAEDIEFGARTIN